MDSSFYESTTFAEKISVALIHSTFTLGILTVLP